MISPTDIDSHDAQHLMVHMRQAVNEFSQGLSRTNNTLLLCSEDALRASTPPEDGSRLQRRAVLVGVIALVTPAIKRRRLGCFNVMNGFPVAAAVSEVLSLFKQRFHQRTANAGGQ